MTFPSWPLSVGEAAALLHVAPNTLRKWADRGLIPCVRLGPRADRRFRLKDVQRLLRKEAR